MNSFVTSLVRTYVPIIVGSLASYLALKGIQLDATALAGLTAFLGGIISAVYYLVVRLLEKKFPQVGVLLGVAAKPTYKEVK
jgi:hypothetical protein